MHILHVVGARPNFMKAAPVRAALSKIAGCRQTLVHTGQHYDANMSDVFFRQLGMPEPDLNLAVGSGSHAQQTAEIMQRFERVVLEAKPGLVVVYGDVNSTLAAAVVCAKLNVAVAHVEAGLRSGDRTMPEEINRLVTDQLSDLLFTPSADADQNLAREGIDGGKVHLVGNVMIDTLVRLLPLATMASVPSSPYLLVTLHRPSNVDDLTWLGELLAVLSDVASRMKVIFPVHPRTRARIGEMQVVPSSANLQFLDPLPYLEFLALQKSATAVITDSGGIQEETTYLGVPCLTVRENTERPVTITLGTNILVGRDAQRLSRALANVLAGATRKGQPVPFWDGSAAPRIAEVIQRRFF
jgi:UDP-N-acetylglucosamine 2-epimerase (non-hydrolysing)